MISLKQIALQSAIGTGIFLMVLCSSHSFGADFYPVPPISGGGNTYAYEPFAMEILGIPSCRYQQVYDASAFTGVLNGGPPLPNGGIITALVFGSDSTFGRGFTAHLDVEIILSVTPREPDQLSTTFSDNVGANALTVLPRRDVLVSCAGAGQAFGIAFSTPYFYNPTDGNLLIEIRDYSQGPLPNDPMFRVSAMDAENMVGDAVSRVFAYNVNATSGTADTIGLVTTLVITPVPEPTVWLLALLGLPICLAWRRWNRSSTRLAKD